MSILHAIILGLVEGITEFLPISSTFHLLFATKILGLPDTEFSRFFDVFIQAGAILPVLIIFWKEWWQDQELIKKVAVSFVPTAIVGFVLHKMIKEVFFGADVLMLSVFIGVGVVFLVSELMVQRKKLVLSKELKDLSWQAAALIGTLQALAVIPGVSRAGAVIVGMMLLGIRRDEAGKYSFLLAVPTILAAAGYDLLKSREAISGLQASNIAPLAVGLIVAFVSSFVVVKWLIQFLRSHSLAGFGWYRLVAGAVLWLGWR